ncbi:MAG: transposase, partial [Pirellulaceae bacterium]|nr:transposase [Pirellulaceae bacterium]
NYFGLTPSVHQSAGKCYHGKITKAGSVLARTALIQAAHTAARDLGPLGHFFVKTRRRKTGDKFLDRTQELPRADTSPEPSLSSIGVRCRQ